MAGAALRPVDDAVTLDVMLQQLGIGHERLRFACLQPLCFVSLFGKRSVKDRERHLRIAAGSAGAAACRAVRRCRMPASLSTLLFACRR